ncbi:unnamed protein product [Adineta ricciae]|uniref:RNA-dependent RNA polymerase n=1 Tax=Adineta ricciae TaxID=249248 RepID=A0A813Y873_ADIRI|nr:unnamed protein product [Adineta ricciae]
MERIVINPEPDGWDDKVPCTLTHLSDPKACEIIHRNLTHYLHLTNFDSLMKLANNINEYSFECTRDEANQIRDNLHLILTSTYSNVWLTIGTNPLHSFGSMCNTHKFYDHTKQLRYTGMIKVWKEGCRATTIKLEVKNSNRMFTIPVDYIQKQLVVNPGHQGQPIQIVMMLNNAVQVYETDSNKSSSSRVGYSTECGLLIDVVSKSCDLLLQFDPPSNAWPFLLSLPLVGHTNKNQRQDNNFQINFTPFTVEEGLITTSLTKQAFPSEKSQYGFEMLQSLGYVFSDKYTTMEQDIQQSFLNIAHRCPNRFYQLCTSAYEKLISNHCCSLADLVRLHTLDLERTTDTIIDMTHMDEQAFEIRTAVLTPMRIIFKPFSREIGNRALRLRGANRYIRVNIRDEDGEELENITDHIRQRLKSKMLTDGIKCMNQTYYLVGSSTSQSKNHSYWFTTLSSQETIEKIQAEFGNFTQIDNLATYAARIGQYFSTSIPTGIRLKYVDMSKCNETQSAVPFYNVWNQLRSWMRIPIITKTDTLSQDYAVFIIKDIYENGYCFTDGCGLISLGLAAKVAENIGLQIKQPSDIPSIFQIRMAGCKGTLVIDPESRSADYFIKVREMPLSLNNQIIRLLSDLGNTYAVFESLQSRMAKPALWHASGDACFNAFETKIVERQQKRFLTVKENLLENKIPLPVNEARNMFGVADVTSKLDYGQCFIQYEVESNGDKRTFKVLEGTVIVTKNPCLYPGDIRKLTAVNVPLLRQCMRNCIVFPTRGARPHSDEISGSDLDGDQYWVYWGKDLKINQPVDPLAHSSAEKLKEPHITTEKIVDYYLNTMSSRCYSLIAEMHTIVADQETDGTFSSKCVQLANLFYRAIDSPKTGESINMDFVNQMRDEYSRFPKFMMKFDRAFYESKSVLEKLYLRAKKIHLEKNDRYETYRTTSFSQISKSPTIVALSSTENSSASLQFWQWILSSLRIYGFA